jgi:hypothetical protein
METQEKTVKTKRSVSARQRFETLKRDKFTCQYCGAKAPDVALHVDHIVPFAKGGTCDIMNLVTSCAQCNGGKSDKKLSDDAAVVKSRKQAELSQDKKQTIGEMAQWQAELAAMDEEISAVNVVLKKINCSLSATGIALVRPMLKKYGIGDFLATLASEISGGYFVNDFASIEKKLKSAKFQKDDPLKSSAFLRLNKSIRGLPFRESRYRWVKAAVDRWVRRGRHQPTWFSKVMDGLDEASTHWDTLDEYVRRIEAANQQRDSKNEGA